ncbi:MAG: hypothetical protein ACYC9R_13140 [Nitrosotalea sp.]
MYDASNPYSAASQFLNNNFSPGSVDPGSPNDPNANGSVINVTGSGDGTQPAAPIYDGSTQAPPGWQTQGNPVGGSPFDSILQAGMNLMPGSSGANPALGYLIPSEAAAFKQFQDAGKYNQLGQTAAGMANPFGPYRSAAATNLTNLETDPNKYLANAPDYQAALSQGLDQASRIDAAQGLGASGKATNDQIKYASQLAAQYLNQDRQSLMQEAGVGFNPADAAGMLMKGGELGVTSQDAALASMFAPFGQNNRQNGLTNSGLTPGGAAAGGGAGNIVGPVTAAARALAGGGSQGGGSSGGIDLTGFNSGLNNNPLSPNYSPPSNPSYDPYGIYGSTGTDQYGNPIPFDPTGGNVGGSSSDPFSIYGGMNMTSSGSGLDLSGGSTPMDQQYGALNTYFPT